MNRGVAGSWRAHSCWAATSTPSSLEQNFAEARPLHEDPVRQGVGCERKGAVQQLNWQAAHVGFGTGPTKPAVAAAVPSTLPAHDEENGARRLTKCPREPAVVVRLPALVLRCQPHQPAGRSRWTQSSAATAADVRRRATHALAGNSAEPTKGAATPPPSRATAPPPPPPHSLANLRSTRQDMVVSDRAVIPQLRPGAGTRASQHHRLQARACQHFCRAQQLA